MTGSNSWSALAPEIDALVELPQAERDARLVAIARTDAARAAALRAWLDAIERSEGLLEHGAATTAGARLGPWRVVRAIGRGGMGEVFLGERADGAFERRVAIKLLRADRATPHERLVQERALLARLRHPGIAQLLDGGVTAEGRPYLVTEWVDGTRLDEWVTRCSPPLAQRVGMLRQIADAVAEAHANLIVHRDLKPANVMVDPQGRARLLDFGIARLVDAGRAATETDDRALTPAFAAPEQLSGAPITTRTDVYALGGLLYWLMTGRTPHATEDLPLAELVARVCGTDPAAPSEIAPARGIDRDLDAIALTALAREPQRRYASADALRADLERWARGEAVAARVPTLFERLRRHVRMHRVESALAAALVAALLAGTAGIAWQARTAARERDAARAERDTALAELERGSVLIDAFGQVLSDAGAEEKLDASAWLDRAIAQVDAAGPADEATRARLLAELAEIEVDRGFPQRAEPLYARLFERHAGALEPAALARAHCLHATALVDAGRVEDAEAALARGTAIAETLTGASRVELVECLGQRGVFAARQHESDRDVPALERAIAELDRIETRHPQRWRRAALVHRLGVVLQQQDRHDEALARFREVHALDRELGTAETPDGASTLSSIAALGAALGRLREADAAYAEAAEILERTAGTSQDLAITLRNWANLKNQRGEPAAAEALSRRAIDIYAATTGAASTSLAFASLELARALGKQGRHEEAQAAYARAVALVDAQRPEGDYLRELVRAIDAQGRAEAGELEAARAIVEPMLQRARDREHARALSALVPVALDLALRAGRYEQAETLARESIVRLGAEFPATHWRVDAARLSLAEALAGRGDREASKRLAAEIAPRLAAELIAGDPRVVRAYALAGAAAPVAPASVKSQ